MANMMGKQQKKKLMRKQTTTVVHICNKHDNDDPEE